MNWFTRENNVTVTEDFETCEHIEVGDIAPHVTSERDSFGYIERYASCKKCHEKSKEAEEEELVTCHDCGNDVAKKQTIEWRWYGFCASQGDAPLIICDSCRAAEKHTKRVRRNKADYEAEMAYYDEQEWAYLR